MSGDLLKTWAHRFAEKATEYEAVTGQKPRCFVVSPEAKSELSDAHLVEEAASLHGVGYPRATFASLSYCGVPIASCLHIRRHALYARHEKPCDDGCGR